MLYEASGRRVKNFLTYLPCSFFSSPFLSPSLLYSVLSHDTHPPCKSRSELNPLKEILNLLAIGSMNFQKEKKFMKKSD